MFSQETADQICQSLTEGKSLRAASAEVGVKHPTVLLWVKTNPEFADQYTRAREVGYQLLADELLEIADEKTEADTNRARLQIDTRKWMLSKMLPKVYGDKVDLNHSGAVTFQKIECVVIDPKD